jgi:hypothetical protein
MTPSFTRGSLPINMPGAASNPANSHKADTHILKCFVYAGRIVDAMREAWTDERLDDLNERVGELGRRMDEGFNRVHEDIRGLDAKLDAKIDAKIGGLRLETRAEFAAVRAEIASLHRLMIQMTGGVIFTIVATQIADRL